jgi:hypothetical protein
MDIHEYEVGLHKNEIDTPALLVDIATSAQYPENGGFL